MRIWTLTAIGLLSIAIHFIAPVALGSNWHDHLFLVPRASDFAEALDATELRDPTLNEALRDVRQPQKVLERLLRESARLSPTIIARERFLDLHHWTVFAFLRRLTLTYQVPIDSLLSFTRIADTSTNRALYLFLFDLRKALYLHSSTQTIERVFARYVRETPIEQRRMLVLTASRSAFRSSQSEKLQRIRDLARRFGSDVRFYMSRQRSDWAQDRLEWPDEWQSLITRDLLHGLDLAGSAEEIAVEPWEKGLNQMDFQTRLLALFDLARANGLILRVHAFEHRNTGPFYEALRSALESYQHPLRIEIAHMAQLTAPWILFISRLPQHLDVTLQSTPASYLHLVDGFSADELDRRERIARERGLMIRYGVDGAGVFEHTWPLHTRQTSAMSCQLFFHIRN